MSVRYRTCRLQKIWFLHNDPVLWLSSTTELHSSKQKIYHRDVGERKKKLYALHVVGSYIIIFNVLQCVHRTHTRRNIIHGYNILRTRYSKLYAQWRRKRFYLFRPYPIMYKPYNINSWQWRKNRNTMRTATNYSVSAYNLNCINLSILSWTRKIRW